MAPNKEVISNGSHTMYFPAQVQVSNTFRINYNINDSNSECSEEFLDVVSGELLESEMIEAYNHNRDIHKILDYTCISEEAVINMILLFSSTPKDTSNSNTILNLMRRIGINSINNSYLG